MCDFGSNEFSQIYSLLFLGLHYFQRSDYIDVWLTVHIVFFKIIYFCFLHYVFLEIVLIFIRTTSILEDVCLKSQKESFFSSLWGCILHSAQIRLPAVTFAVNHLAKHSDEADKKYVFGNDLKLMVCLF